MAIARKVEVNGPMGGGLHGRAGSASRMQNDAVRAAEVSAAVSLGQKQCFGDIGHLRGRRHTQAFHGKCLAWDDGKRVGPTRKAEEVEQGTGRCDERTSGLHAPSPLPSAHYSVQIQLPRYASRVANSGWPWQGQERVEELALPREASGTHLRIG